MVYVQLITQQHDGGWSTIDTCYVFNGYGEPTDRDIANANELAAIIRSRSKKGQHIAMIDGMYESTLADKVRMLNNGRIIAGYPPDSALCVLASLVSMHPLEIGLGADNNQPYKYHLSAEAVNMRVLVREANKWMTSDPQTR